MQKLDGKFTGIVASDRTGLIVPPDQFVVFLAKDNAFPSTLKFYIEECRRIGADAEQICAVERLYVRVMEWRTAHSDLCKIPDAAAGECQ